MMQQIGGEPSLRAEFCTLPGGMVFPAYYEETQKETFKANQMSEKTESYKYIGIKKKRPEKTHKVKRHNIEKT